MATLKPSTASVLGYLMLNGSITGREAIDELGTTEVRSRISELRKAGYIITDAYEEGWNKYGDPVRYKRYRLEESKNEQN